MKNQDYLNAIDELYFQCADSEGIIPLIGIPKYDDELLEADHKFCEYLNTLIPESILEYEEKLIDLEEETGKYWFRIGFMTAVALKKFANMEGGIHI